MAVAAPGVRLRHSYQHTYASSTNISTDDWSKMESFTALSHRAQVARLRRLAAAALAEYDLPGARLAPLVHAFNTTFQVTDAGGNRYALRIIRPGKCTV